MPSNVRAHFLSDCHCVHIRIAAKMKKKNKINWNFMNLIEFFDYLIMRNFRWIKLIRCASEFNSAREIVGNKSSANRYRWNLICKILSNNSAFADSNRRSTQTLTFNFHFLKFYFRIKFKFACHRVTCRLSNLNFFLLYLREEAMNMNILAIVIWMINGALKQKQCHLTNQ